MIGLDIGMRRPLCLRHEATTTYNEDVTLAATIKLMSGANFYDKFLCLFIRHTLKMVPDNIL